MSGLFETSSVFTVSKESELDIYQTELWQGKSDWSVKNLQ